MEQQQLDNTILAALKFAEYAHKPDSPFSGTVLFNIHDAVGNGVVRAIQVCGAGVPIHIYEAKPPDSVCINCVVTVEKTVLLAILTGAIEASTAFLWGQLYVDNIAIMTDFTKAFDFSHEKFLEFQQSLANDCNENCDDTCNNSNTDDGASKIDDVSNQPDGASLPTVAIEHSREKTQDTRALEVVPFVSLQLARPTSPSKKPLKQTLAIKSLFLLQALHGAGKEIDALLERVKEKEKVKKALDELNEKKEELQATAMYKQMQTHPVYVTLVSELERAGVGAAVLGQKAKGVGMEVVGKLATIAYPPIEENINHNNNTAAVTTTTLTVTASAAADKQSAKDLDVAKREQKRMELQARLEQLQAHNQDIANNKPAATKHSVDMESKRESKKLELQARLEKLQAYNQELSKQRQESLAKSK